MRKLLVSTLVAVVSYSPLAASAAINSIDSLTAADQFLVSPGSGAANSMHMNIVNVGTDTHRFKWDGSAWRIDQGGTGVLSLPVGILLGDGTSPITSATVLSPITLVSGQLGCVVASSTQDGCLSASDWVRFDAAANATPVGPAGSNKQIQFNNAGAFGANANFIYDPATGFFAAGTSTQYRPNEKWEFVSQTGDSIGQSFFQTNYNSSADSPFAAYSVRTARGTVEAPQALHSGDFIGAITFSGYDGASFPLTSPVRIHGFASENWTPTARGAGLTFSTTPNGSTGRVSRMTITPSGVVSVSGNLSANGFVSCCTSNTLIATTTGRGSDVLTIGANQGTIATVRIDGPQGSCIALKDSDGDGYTYLTVNDGVASFSTTQCD